MSTDDDAKAHELMRRLAANVTEVVDHIRELTLGPSDAATTLLTAVRVLLLAYDKEDRFEELLEMSEEVAANLAHVLVSIAPAQPEDRS